MTDKTRVLGIRLPVEVHKWVDTGVNMRKVIEWLYVAVNEGKVEIEDGEVVDLRIKGVKNGVLEDLKVMCELSGSTLGNVLNDLQEKLDKCELNLVDGAITWVEE